MLFACYADCPNFFISGTLVRTDEGLMPIEAIQVVYNFTVAGVHSYFVLAVGC